MAIKLTQEQQRLAWSALQQKLGPLILKSKSTPPSIAAFKTQAQKDKAISHAVEGQNERLFLALLNDGESSEASAPA